MREVSIMKKPLWIYTGTFNHEDYPKLGLALIVAVMTILGVS